MNALKNRILAHLRVPAGNLKPHPLNFRLHPEGQKTALRAILEEVGLARSLLAYVSDDDRQQFADRPLEDMPLTLIDGHLRQEELAEHEVDVEVLDVNDEEARKLLLSMDPLAALAECSHEALDQLRQATETAQDALANLWAQIDASQQQVPGTNGDGDQGKKPRRTQPQTVQQFLVIIECHSERHQVDVLRACRKQGLECKAVMS